MTPRTEPNPFLRALAAYTPGDQPRDPRSIKLNTNEFPYPAAPGVLEAIRRAGDDSIRLYPASRCDALRAKLGEIHGVAPEQIFVANGSDEVLRLVIQAYSGPGRMTAMTSPTYSLYPTLVQLTGSSIQDFPLEDMERLPPALFEARCDLLLLCVPNPPMGTLFSPGDLARLAETSGLLLLDEAYIDFAQGVTNFNLLQARDNVILCRTFSKSFGLAGLRVGYAIAHPEVIALLDKLADSYNVNRISQAAALAALESSDYYRDKVALIRRDRDRLREALVRRGYRVPESHGNFLFAFHDRAKEIYEGLRQNHIYVRYFAKGGLAGGIRISIGTGEQMDQLVAAIDSLS